EVYSGTPEKIVAYRGHHRWAQRFEPLAQLTFDERRLPLKEKGVYLITGGLGELGMVVSRHLAERFAARLVLVGRTPLPETRSLRSELNVATQSAAVQRILKNIGR